jgi:replicative DNA helicase
MGKTALALNLATNACIESNLAAAVFSLEMSKEQLVQRLLCSEARVDSSKLRGGYLKETDWPKLIKAASQLSKAPLFIDDTPALSVLEMRAKSRRLKKEHALGLIVVDYLQLMRSDITESREREISDISRSLKALAKELHVPVVALSQLNRGVELRQNRRPQLSDLRESGAIEQDADVIAFIYRDEVYNKDTPERGVAEIIIGKQRNGPTGTVKLKFFNEFTRFEELEENYGEMVPEYSPPSFD